MKPHHSQTFDVHHTLHELKHFLPAQAPLKDFIHHNTLHAFQQYSFFEALLKASTIFGYKTILHLDEFRKLIHEEKIKPEVLEAVIVKTKGKDELLHWKKKILEKKYHVERPVRIGQLRKYWKKYYHVDLDLYTQPILFRILCNFFDQGISLWKLPFHQKGFLAAIRSLEKNTMSSIFRTPRANKLLFSTDLSIEKLLKIIVGDEALYEHYLFDQQFTHPGWSGMVAVIEAQPQSLLDHRNITLEEVIIFELLLEIDYLDSEFGHIWAPLSTTLDSWPQALFDEIPTNELDDVLQICQEAYEISFYDEVLRGVQASVATASKASASEDISFQALFCIDDRECSIRRYIEHIDPRCRTYGTPGFFGVEFYYQPQDGKFHTKVCPAPVSPQYIIKEIGSANTNEKDLHFHKQSHSLVWGWFMSQSLGFWSAIKLALNIFKPSLSPAASYSFRHMNHTSELIIENTRQEVDENGLKIGFTVEEMAVRVEKLLRSIGLVNNFAPIIYAIGHGSTSVNNTHYAGYDCGACSGRPGSVNARVIAFMGNHKGVRKILAEKGLLIPEKTQFIGALRDTSRDTIVFYDVDTLHDDNKKLHQTNEQNFFTASDYNSKERTRRFESINTHEHPKKTHEAVKLRSVSLFEPRPELNHATNTLCIVGRRHLTKNVFLDRRAFLNSYDYTIDPEGTLLQGILNAAAPVCGGINLEYYFSRVDNQKLGAGTKLSHNVMGLFGVANGIDGDLRTGLPSQMIEVHDPLRLLMVVEHYPAIVLQTIQANAATYEWFHNQWVNLICIHPETAELYKFEKGDWQLYEPVIKEIKEIQNLSKVIETTQENIPVSLLNQYEL